jgi:hypothetical protein
MDGTEGFGKVFDGGKVSFGIKFDEQGCSKIGRLFCANGS